MKKILISAVGIGMCLAAMPQYLPQVSYFMYDDLRTNPGSAGSMDMICVNGIYRNQMVGFPGNPENYFINVEAPFSLFGTKHGAGFSFHNDVIGFNTDINVKINYAFRFSVGDGTLGIGLDGGIIQNTLTPDWHRTDGDAGNDPYIPNNSPDNKTFSLGAGIFYRTEDIYFGISALNLNSPEVITTPETGGGSESVYNLKTQFYVTAGYNMQLANPAWELKPAVLLKSDIIATDLDLNLTCMYNKKIWGGVTYRTGEAVVGMFGLTLMEGLKLGIAYDFQTSALMNDTWGTYEVMINYSFKVGVEKAPQKYKSIRFL
jgi:type IX secretion system PorP/SprF family membrane protein